MLNDMRNAIKRNIAAYAVAGAALATPVVASDYGLLFQSNFENGTYSDWSAVANTIGYSVPNEYPEDKIPAGCHVVGTDIYFPLTRDIKKFDVTGREMGCPGLVVRAYARGGGATEIYTATDYDPVQQAVEMVLFGGQPVNGRPLVFDNFEHRILDPEVIFPQEGHFQQH